jgi:hypothetical protein
MLPIANAELQCSVANRENRAADIDATMKSTDITEDNTDNSGPQKRKASSSSPQPDDEDSPKRQKFQDDGDGADRGYSADRNQSPVRRPSEPSRDTDQERRKSFTHEERKRGQRLFGGLLSTLSQTTTSSQQKKRQEIERRQQDKVIKQRADDDRKHAEKLARITDIRRQEQIKYDEKVVCRPRRNA